MATYLNKSCLALLTFIVFGGIFEFSYAQSGQNSNFLRWDGQDGRPSISGPYYLETYEGQVVAGGDELRLWQYQWWTEEVRSPKLDSCAEQNGIWDCPLNYSVADVGIDPGGNVWTSNFEYPHPASIFKGRGQEWTEEFRFPWGDPDQIRFSLDFGADGFAWGRKYPNELVRLDQHGNTENFILPNDSLWKIYKTGNGELFLALNGYDEIYYFDPGTEKLDFLINIDLSIHPYFDLLDLDYDGQGNLWIRLAKVEYSGTIGNQDQFTTEEMIGYVENGQFFQVEYLIHDSRYKSEGATDLNEGFWLAMDTPGELVSFRHYTRQGFQQKFDAPSCGSDCPAIFDMVRDRDNNFWVSFESSYWVSENRFLTVFNPDGVRFSPPPNDFFGELEVFPNPFREELHLRLPVAWEGEVEVFLYDLKGGRVHHQFLSGEDGFPRERTFSPSGLRPGIYLLRAQHGEEIATQKVILAR